MIRVYCANPYSGSPEQIKANINYAIEHADRVGECTLLEPVIPHLFDLWDDVSKLDRNYNDWMSKCYDSIQSCACILVDKMSGGVRKEIKYARANGIPVFNDVDLIRRLAIKAIPVVTIWGASGAGKSALVQALMENFPGIYEEPVSYTTRPPRERDGVAGSQYKYLTRDEYADVIQTVSPIGQACFNGHMYFTTYEDILDIIERGKIPINIVTWDAAVEYADIFAKDKISTVSVWLNASEVVRQRRMLAQGRDPKEVDSRIEYDRRYITDFAESDVLSNENFFMSRLESDHADVESISFNLHRNIYHLLSNNFDKAVRERIDACLRINTL